MFDKMIVYGNEMTASPDGAGSVSNDCKIAMVPPAVAADPRATPPQSAQLISRAAPFLTRLGMPESSDEMRFAINFTFPEAGM